MKRDSQPIPKPFQGQRQQSNRPTLKKRIYDQTFESTVYPQQTSRNLILVVQRIPKIWS
jgi:hypothetical protein